VIRDQEGYRQRVTEGFANAMGENVKRGAK
jgi:hypothetical protein